MTAAVAARAAPAAKSEPTRSASARPGLDGAANETTGVGNLLEQLHDKGLRANLAIGGAGDPEEREADQFADAVMGGSRAPCTCGGSCPKCSGGGGGGVIRRKAEGAPAAAATVSRAFRGPGRNLDLGTRARFESRAGLDLSGVRVHNDDHAATTAKAIGARAYTVGNNIGFARGAYNPGTSAGQRLLAHELGHVALGHGGVRRLGGSDYTDDHFLNSFKSKADREVLEHKPTDRELIDSAIKNKSVSDAKAIKNYGQCSDDERIQLIQILLSQGWVGPLDEYALEGLWGSAGAKLVEFASAHVAEWNMSVARGAELAKLPAVVSYCNQFLDNAKPTTEFLLADSEMRIKMELTRYGLSREDDYTPDATGDGPGTTSKSYGMSDGPASVGVKAAAAVLLAKRNEVAAKVKDKEKYETDPPDSIATQITDEAKWEEANTALVKSQQESEILRMAMEQKYPILAAFADDDSGLESVAEGKGQGPAGTLYEAGSERLENITTVREKLADSPEKIWRLPPVVAATKASMGIVEGSIQAGFVDAKIDQVETDSTLVDLALGAIALALGLLAALPTGGGSLVAAGAVVGAVGSVGVSAATAFMHIREYQFKSAANGTDFDKARAVSGEDPSLFWLALDIVAVGIDLSAAVGVFKSLGPAARLAAAGGKDSELALKSLREAAVQQGEKGSALAERVVSSAERLQKAAGSIEETMGAAGAKSVDKTVVEAAAIQTEDAVTVVGKVGQVKAAPSGIWTCASPCTMLREKYMEQLVTKPDLATELLALEKEAKAAAQDSGKLADIAERAKTLEGKLREITTGKWTSPLAETGDYTAILKRRGSASFDLDRRPPDWHGADEAKFRFGEKAAAEVGYRWRLEADGTLRYVRDNAQLEERMFDAVGGIFRKVEAAPARVVLESDEELVKLAAVGASATSKAEWLGNIRKAVPSVSGVSDEALLRVLNKSPNLDHMRGELLEAMVGVDLAKRATATGGEFVQGSRITDAAGRQLSDGMIIKRTLPGEAEVMLIGESKAGEGAAKGLSADHKSFNSLSEVELSELRREAIEELRVRKGLSVDEASGISGAARSSQIEAKYGAEIEAIMRDLHTEDMGQVVRNYERMMPNFGANSTTILVDGQPLKVTVNRSTTKVLASAPADVGLNAAIKTGKDASIGVEALNVGADSALLETIARQLRAEQIKNGVRFP